MRVTPLPVTPTPLEIYYELRPADLRRARAAAGLSQQQLADILDMAGWQQQKISEFESGDTPKKLDEYALGRFKKAGFHVTNRG